jgi:hypothetical protein
VSTPNKEQYIVLDTEFNTYLGPFDSVGFAKRQITTGYANQALLHSCGSKAKCTSGKWLICRLTPELVTTRFVSKHGEGVVWSRVKRGAT